MLNRKLITIDARWVSSSGLGTYLTYILPGVIREFANCDFALMGNESEINSLLGPGYKNYYVIHSNDAMYSIKEQIGYIKKIPKKTKLYFSPHYNIPLFYRGNMLVTVHDLFHLAMPEFNSGFSKISYAKLMFYALSKRASAIITVSNFTKLELLKNIRFSSEKVYPIHLGVCKSFFSFNQLSQLVDFKYILFVGNIKPHKNLSTLIKAFKFISKLIPHKLILVGKKEGFITGDKAVLAEDKISENRIIFTGKVGDLELKSYYKYADLLVFPSFYEGFGLPALEAMASGCPVLVSNISSLREICGDAAIYCNPNSEFDIAEKILLILKNSELKNSLIKIGLEKSTNYEWDTCISNTNKVIHSVL